MYIHILDIYICIYMHMHIYVYMYIHTCIYMHIHNNRDTTCCCLEVSFCMLAGATRCAIPLNVRIYIHVHTYIYVYIYSSPTFSQSPQLPYFYSISPLSGWWADTNRIKGKSAPKSGLDLREASQKECDCGGESASSFFRYSRRFFAERHSQIFFFYRRFRKGCKIVMYTFCLEVRLHLFDHLHPQNTAGKNGKIYEVDFKIVWSTNTKTIVSVKTVFLIRKIYKCVLFAYWAHTMITKTWWRQERTFILDSKPQELENMFYFWKWCLKKRSGHWRKSKKPVNRLTINERCKNEKIDSKINYLSADITNNRKRIAAHLGDKSTNLYICGGIS